MLDNNDISQIILILVLVLIVMLILYNFLGQSRMFSIRVYLRNIVMVLWNI